MRGRHFVVGSREEIHLSTGKVLVKGKGTTSQMFVPAAEEWVRENLGTDLVVQRITMKDIEAFNLYEARQERKKAKGLYREIMDNYLKIVNYREATKPKKPEPTRRKLKDSVQITLEDMREENERRKAHAKRFKTEAEAVILANKTRIFRGWKARFIPYKDPENKELIGRIRRVHVDRRTNTVHVRLEVDKEGRRTYHKAVKNIDILPRSEQDTFRYAKRR